MHVEELTILNRKTNKSIKVYSSYFKKLYKEQRETGVKFFNIGDLKKLGVNTKKGGSDPRAIDVARQSTANATSPQRDIVRLRNVQYTIPMQVQNKLKSYVNQIQQRRKEEMKADINQYCVNYELISKPIIHSRMQVSYTYYAFPDFNKDNLDLPSFFSVYTMDEFSFAQNSYIDMVHSSEYYYRNNFKPEFVNMNQFEDNFLDVEWFNEMNEYIGTFTNETLMLLHTYTWNGDVIVNSYLRNKLRYEDLMTEYHNKEYKKKNLSPFFIPFNNVYYELIKKFTNPQDLVIEIFDPTITEKKFQEYVTKNSYRGIVDKKTYREILIEYLYSTAINYRTYLLNVLLVPLMKKEFIMKLIQNYAESIQSMINDAPSTKKKMTLYRGLRKDYVFERKQGVFFKNEGFLSVTNKYSTTAGFMTGDCCFHYITVLPGTKMLWMAGLSKVPREGEFLLGLNTTYLIRSHQKEDLPIFTEKNMEICDPPIRPPTTVIRVVAV